MKSREIGSKTLEFPVLIRGLNSPLELLAESLGEDSLEWNIELLAEHHSQSGVDVILY